MMRKLIICCDGTWNEPDQEDRGKRKPTNIVKIARAIKPVDSSGLSQIVFYDKGVGTGSLFDKVTGGVTGEGLEENVIDAYRFFVYNYEPGDEVFIFGFSRGAYTARSLTGLVDKCGVLPKTNAFYMPEAFAIYRAKEDASEFKTTQNCRSMKIRFLGVFDTVGARGVPLDLFESTNEERFGFHDVGLSACVENAFHALAIDEQRKPFTPSLWDKKVESHQTMEQRWFAGVHTNIGGGYDNDGLANCPLHWIVDAAAQRGLEFDTHFLGFYKPFPLDEIRDSMTLYYRVLGKHIREIGKTIDGNEKIDPSVTKRKNAPKDDFPHRDGPYRPSNVL